MFAEKNMKRVFDNHTDRSPGANTGASSKFQIYIWLKPSIPSVGGANAFQTSGKDHQSFPNCHIQDRSELRDVVLNWCCGQQGLLACMGVLVAKCLSWAD